jgi:uncharacterized protein (DUF2235 family)
MSSARNARHRDTVCSVGIVPRTLPFTASNTSIRHFRHALSLDERRAKFKANHYHLQKPDDEAHDDGQTETDVKEVWFAGCHCGNFLLVSNVLGPDIVL